MTYTVVKKFSDPKQIIAWNISVTRLIAEAISLGDANPIRHYTDMIIHPVDIIETP